MLLFSAGTSLAQIADTTLWLTNGNVSSGGGLMQAVGSKLWGTNGTVHSVVCDGATVYLGGAFTKVSPVTGGAAVIDASSGLPQQPYPEVTAAQGVAVRRVAPDGSGGWYLAGDFTEVRGEPRQHLAHMDADGNLTAWNPIPDGQVQALAVSGGTVYVGGDFKTIGGQPRNHVAAIDAASGAVTAWNPGARYIVSALATSGSTVYVGDGDRLSAIGTADDAAIAWEMYTYGIVHALAVSGGKVYAGGSFGCIAGDPEDCDYGYGVPRNNLAAFDSVSGAVTAWNPNAEQGIYDLAVSEGTVYIGGTFSYMGGVQRVGIAAVDTASGAVTSWNPTANASVWALALSGSTVYAGGFFTTIGGQSRSNIAALDTASGAATAWNPSATGLVASLAANGEVVCAGGAFTGVGALMRNNIAALDAASGAATAWNPNSNDEVFALALGSGGLYAGGKFTSIGGQTRHGVAALDAVSGAVTGWNPSASYWVRALAVSGGTVYAGGDFKTIGGQARNFIAALDATSGAATAWNPNPDGSPIRALAVSGSTVYAGGVFHSIGGQPRNNLAALDGVSGAATAWNPGTNGAVGALAVSGSTIYVGDNDVRAIDAADSAANARTVNTDGNINTLTVSGGTVYVGGAFHSIGGQPRNNLAAIDAASGGVTAWNLDANADVHALALSGGTVYAGGNFTRIGGVQSPFLAAIPPDIPTATLPLDFPSAISVTPLSIALGESFTIAATARNFGPATDDARISIAFPSLTGPNDGELAVSVPTGDTPGYREYAAGSSIPDSACHAIVAGYLTTEYADSAWGYAESNTFAVTVTPRAVGTFYFDVRGVRRDTSIVGNSCLYVNGLPSGGVPVTDQQGWTVRRFAVTVNAPGTPPTVSWQPITGPAGGPGGRSDAAAVFDPGRHALAIFGGQSPSYQGDAWWLPLGGGPWQRFNPGGTKPTPRILHSMIMDLADNELVIFGGRYDHFLNDVQALPLTAPLQWVPNPGLGDPPSARGGHAAIYDPVRNRMLVIAGDNGAKLNDVWECSPAATGTWRQLSPLGNPMPPRLQAAAVYDPVRDRVIVFGGDGGELLNDVWELNLSGEPTWGELHPTGTPPTPRRAHTAIYDPVGDRVIVYGGYDENFQRRGDLWALTLSGEPFWQMLVSDTPSPVGRSGHVAVYDPEGQRMIMYGGLTGPGQYSSEVWALSLGATTPAAVSLASVDVASDLVRLTWSTEGAANLKAMVQRSVAGSDEWVEIGNPTVSGADKLVFEDRSVVAGARYGYRLLISDGAMDPTWVTVPMPAILSLAGASPNPSPGGVAVRFSLPGNDAARLELFDLKGRRIAAREVGTLGPGEHLVPLSERLHLAAGVYLVRLTQGSRTLTAKACVVK